MTCHPPFKYVTSHVSSDLSSSTIQTFSVAASDSTFGFHGNVAQSIAHEEAELSRFKTCRGKAESSNRPSSPKSVLRAVSVKVQSK